MGIKGNPQYDHAPIWLLHLNWYMLHVVVATNITSSASRRGSNRHLGARRWESKAATESDGSDRRKWSLWRLKRLNNCGPSKTGDHRGRQWCGPSGTDLSLSKNRNPRAWPVMHCIADLLSRCFSPASYQVLWQLAWRVRKHTNQWLKGKFTANPIFKRKIYGFL